MVSPLRPDGERKTSFFPLLTSASMGMCALLSPQEDSLREYLFPEWTSVIPLLCGSSEG